MKVWTVEYGTEYESNALQAIYDSRDKAIKHVEDYLKLSYNNYIKVQDIESHISWEQGTCFIDIDEMEVL